MLLVIDINSKKNMKINFEIIPVNQLMRQSPDFNIYFNLQESKKYDHIYVQFPLFPFTKFNVVLSQCFIKHKDSKIL